MRVLHVISTLDRGGIASSLRQLLPVLSQGDPFTIEIAILYGESLHQAAMAGHNIPIHHLKLTSKYDGRGLFRLVRLFRTGRYDVVHAHGWPAVLLVALASLWASQPRFVLTEHSVTNRRRRLRLKPLDRFVYSRFQHVIAVSQAAADALVAWLPQLSDRITLIYNGLNPSSFKQTADVRGRVRQSLGIGPQTPLLLFSGGWQYHKGPDVLLHALAHLEKASAQVESSPMRPLTLITGDGPLGAELRELVAALNLTEQVRFLGFRTDLIELMAAADLFVLASRWEGCPMAVLEAMTMGLPLIATSVGGVPELIEDGKSGLLLSADDAPRLSQAIALLLADRALACRLAQIAQQRVSDCFTVEQGAQAVAAVYRALR